MGRGCLERSAILGAGAGGAAGVSAESLGLLGALLVELGDLGSLAHSLEIDTDHAALVVVSGGSILSRWGTVLARGGAVLAGRGTWVSATVSSLGSRDLALLAQQNLTDLLQQLGIYVLSLGRLASDTDGLVLATGAERGRRSSRRVSTTATSGVSTASTR